MDTPTPSTPAPRKPFNPWPGLCILLVGCLVGGWFLWDGVFRDRVFPKRWASVHEGSLYRSGELSHALVEQTWRDNGVEVVVNLGRDKPDRDNHDAALEAADELGIDRQLFNLNGDGTGKVEVFTAAVARIVRAQDAGLVTHVHCKAGQHRTGAVIATYRVLYDDWSGQRALDEMMTFEVQKPERIINYLNENLPTIAQGLVDKGLLEAVPEPMPVLPAL